MSSGSRGGITPPRASGPSSMFSALPSLPCISASPLGGAEPSDDGVGLGHETACSSAVDGRRRMDERVPFPLEIAKEGHLARIDERALHAGVEQPPKWRSWGLRA